MSPKIDRIPLAIAGAGVVGFAIGKELAEISEFAEGTFLFEKGSHLGEGQSGRNSGVIHAGLYYPPDSLKARLCIEGCDEIKRFALDQGVAFIETGKYILATDSQEDKTLDIYIEKSLENYHRYGSPHQDPGIEKVSGQEVTKKIPSVNCYSALYSRRTGIIDAASYLQALKQQTLKKGAHLLLRHEILAVHPTTDYVELEVKQPDGKIATYHADVFINAAGLSADYLAKMINPKFTPSIEPVRGEYCQFTITRENIDTKETCLYPVPRVYTLNGKTQTSLGIHLTPTFSIDYEGRQFIGKTVLVGPTAHPIEERNDYANNRMSIKYFHEQIKSFFPNIKEEDLQLGDCGIRAKLKDYSDFIIERDAHYHNCVNIVGSDSPFLTASLRAGPYVKQLLGL